MRAQTVVAAAFALAACGVAGDDAGSNATLEDLENVSGLDSAANNPTPVPAPRLEPLSPAEIERELTPGAGCELSSGEQLLLVAAGANAIVKANGRLVRLTAQGPVEPNGAYFASDAVRVSIGRASERGRRGDRTARWPARAAVSSPASDKPAEIEAVWTCGA